MGEIERTLRRGASMPYTEHNKGKVEAHKLEIQEILGTLTIPSSPSHDETLSVGDSRATDLAPVDPRATATMMSVFESGTF